jgi:pilus assembly protein CpaC
MQAGQTLAMAGLVQTLLASENTGIPFLGDLPYVGMFFRNMQQTKNEVELLMLVTPELVEAMDAKEVPQCLPGTSTTTPSDWEFYMKGHLEVPNCQPANGGGNPSTSAAGNTPPPDGMILDKTSDGRPVRNGPSGVTPQGVDTSAGSYNRQTPPNPHGAAAESQNGPPAFIGPVGYDVEK